MWADRHIIRLATFDAVRVLAQTPASERAANGGKFCWKTEPQNEEEKSYKEMILGRLKKQAVNKTAAISPDVTYFAAQMPWIGAGATRIAEVLNQAQTALPGGDSDVVKALRKFVLSYPTAWAFTYPTKCEEEGGHVTLELTYYRAPKMPYVGGLMWINRLSQMLKANTGNRVSLAIDPLTHFQVTPEVDGESALSEFQMVRTQLRDALDLATELDWPEIAGSQWLQSIPGVSELDSIFSGTNFVSESLTRASSGGALPLDRLVTEVRSLSAATTAFAYAVPDALRVIPMRVSVRFSTEMPMSENAEEPYEGKALLVAPFFGDRSKNPWVGWAENMSRHQNRQQWMQKYSDLEVRE